MYAGNRLPFPRLRRRSQIRYLPSLSHTDVVKDVEFDESNVQKLWTSESSSHLEFRYAHSQSSLQFIVKVSRLGGKTVIMGIALGDDKTTSFDIKTEDFTSAAFFPWTGHSEDGTERDVVGGFIRESRMKDLASLFKINILQKLIPGLNKTGYAEEEQSSQQPSTSTVPGQPRYRPSTPV